MSELNSAMTNAGANSKGVVFGLRSSGFNHYFNVINQNGTIVYLDGQIGATANICSPNYVGFLLMPTFP
ncbi:MAG: hypothetical protein IPK83_01810 [Planctomycetes bacterium]|nr:hypothetical protein [Planctomycetota bacterium]